jgi:hypothetical protein
MQSMTPNVGFIVIYRWRLHADMEKRFQEIWSRNTPQIALRCGGLGSRLHKAEDGTWLAYAQWPDKETWERSYSVPDWDLEGREAMQEAIIERLPRILLYPIADFLVRAEINAQL